VIITSVAPDGYTVYGWAVDGTPTDENGDTYTFSSNDIGPHNVTLGVEKDGKIYSTTIKITVGK